MAIWLARRWEGGRIIALFSNGPAIENDFPEIARHPSGGLHLSSSISFTALVAAGCVLTASFQSTFISRMPRGIQAGRSPRCFHSQTKARSCCICASFLSSCQNSLDEISVHPDVVGGFQAEGHFGRDPAPAGSSSSKTRACPASPTTSGCSAMPAAAAREKYQASFS